MKYPKILLPLLLLALLLAGGGAWFALGPLGEESSAAGTPSTPPAPQSATTQSPAATQTAKGEAGLLAVTEDDHVLGSAEAPVTVIEYASLTCPHCAAFHRETMPQVKSEWIETGKARLVYRHFPLDGAALRAAAVADCLESDKAFFGFIDVLFSNQSKWAVAGDPMAEVGKFARLAGLGQERFQACANDEAAMQQILAKRQAAGESLGVQSTPSFLVNGRLISGALPYDEFQKILAEAAGAS